MVSEPVVVEEDETPAGEPMPAAPAPAVAAAATPEAEEEVQPEVIAGGPHDVAATFQWLVANAPEVIPWITARNEDAMRTILKTPGLFEESKATLLPHLHDTLDNLQAFFHQS